MDKKTTEQPSLLPLSVGRMDRGHGHYLYAILDSAGNPVAEGFTNHDAPALMANAVNNHDRLLKAVERAIPAVGAWVLETGNKDAAETLKELTDARDQAKEIYAQDEAEK